MKKALFFDLDGTLWDAIVPLTESWNEAMIKASKPYRFDLDKMKSYMGLTPEETCPLAFKDLNLEEGMKVFSLCLENEIKYLSKNPGTLYRHEREVLNQLCKKYPLYIVSNSGKGYIENYLQACKMTKYFTGHLCAGDTLKDKWENIRILKQKEGIGKVIYIGDTKKDMIQTEKAGEIFIHASYGFGQIDENVYRINSLDELPELVEKIFG